MPDAGGPTRVWVVAEDAAEPPTREALGEAAALAAPARPGVLLAGPPSTREGLGALCAYGAGRLVLLRTERPIPPAQVGIAAGAWLRAAAGPPPVVVLPHTRSGVVAAAHLAVELDAPWAPDALAVRWSADGGLEVVRPAYADRLHATVHIAPGTAAIVTLRPGALGVGPPVAGPAAAIEEHPATTAGRPAALRTRRILAADPRTVDLRDAERIVAGGRGVGAEGFALLQRLADLLGAALGGSRVAVDQGWLPWERQIGQSGRTVAPALYLAFGISGASQHLAGLRDARTVVAVNVDRTAPILERAQLGVVADWRPVVEALIERLQAGRRPA